MLAFLESGGSASRTGTKLFVHQNTVAYRLKRAEELMRRKLSDRLTELVCALTLTATLGPAVLDQEQREPVCAW